MADTGLTKKVNPDNLRSWADWCHGQNIKSEVKAVLNEAADEIERLDEWKLKMLDCLREWDHTGEALPTHALIMLGASSSEPNSAQSLSPLPEKTE
jgi:hypothetical protein